ncbi:MAG: glycosyltransferase family 9 protein [Thermoanaerobaculia bacterium]|nr:glycosyltransferase family 9 protein [Thermoanaerobaculia bacterium]MBP9823494.1 glycosyltransferase family 9 protein [Thermoanaerobaculia bacterium]
MVPVSSSPTTPEAPRGDSGSALAAGVGAGERLLLVRLSAIGDIVHTLPVAAALAAAGFEVVWAVQPAGRPLVAGNPAVAACVTIPARSPFVPGAISRAVAELRAARIDIALDLQGLWKSSFWARVSGARRRIGFGGSARREPLSSLMLTERHALPPGVTHVIDKNLALLAALGLSAVGRREFPLPPFEREASRVDRELAALAVERPILFHPGGGWSSKLWPAEQYGELARRLARRRIPTLVCWGPGEEALAHRVVTASGGAAIASFPASLLEFAALARRARAIVAADTGPLHLACAVGTPAVALFGPTDPARNGPWNPADIVLARRPACFPCHRRECATHRGILHEIPVAEVEQALLARIGLADAG